MKSLFEPVVLVQNKIKMNGTIRKVIQQYRNCRVPMRALLSDYRDVLYKESILHSAENPWLYLHSGIRKEPVETGASEMETAFIFGAMELVKKKQAPTDVINAAFYANQRNNDSPFELSFLLPLFLEEADPLENILIVNPSPDVLLLVEQKHVGHKAYLVTDETVADLYRKEFPESEFYPFEAAGSVNNIDRLLIINAI